MGGKLEVRNGSCKRCNGDFGLAEAELKEAIKPLLNLLKVKNRKGIVPSVALNAEIRGLDMKKPPAFIDGAGNINFHDTVTKSITEDGKIIEHGFFMTAKGSDTFVKRSLARGGKLIEREVPKQIVADVDYTLTTSFAFSLQARRVIGKIALTAIALEYGIPFALSPQFDAFRQALVSKELPVWIFANVGFMGAHLRTAHQHSVMCYLSPGWRRGWVLVTLFGGLTYRVDVTKDYVESQSRQFSIFYDAVSKKRMNPIVLANEMTLVGHVLSPVTKFEDRDAVDGQWRPVITEFCADKGIIVERIVGAVSGAANP
jgi:hypothetical protein